MTTGRACPETCLSHTPQPQPREIHISRLPNSGASSSSPPSASIIAARVETVPPAHPAKPQQVTPFSQQPASQTSGRKGRAFLPTPSGDRGTRWGRPGRAGRRSGAPARPLHPLGLGRVTIHTPGVRNPPTRLSLRASEERQRAVSRGPEPEPGRQSPEQAAVIETV